MTAIDHDIHCQVSFVQGILAVIYVERIEIRLATATAKHNMCSMVARRLDD